MCVDSRVRPRFLAFETLAGFADFARVSSFPRLEEPTFGWFTRVGQCETGIEAGAPAFFRKNTRNLAGCVLLALRETVWMSLGDS